MTLMIEVEIRHQVLFWKTEKSKKKWILTQTQLNKTRFYFFHVVAFHLKRLIERDKNVLDKDFNLHVSFLSFCKYTLSKLDELWTKNLKSVSHSLSPSLYSPFSSFFKSFDLPLFLKKVSEWFLQIFRENSSIETSCWLIHPLLSFEMQPSA
jgi:hypothetical protein